MTLNNNHATSHLLATLRPIKKAITTYFKTDVISETGGWAIPPHKIVMRVSNDFVEYGTEDATPTQEERLIEAMARNPYVTISFTTLSRSAPETVNADTVTDFIDYLSEHGFVPDDVEVVLSPYNLKAHSQAGALNLVVIFAVENYGQEVSEPTAADAPSTDDKPRRVNPLDYLTV